MKASGNTSDNKLVLDFNEASDFENSFKRSESNNCRHNKRDNTERQETVPGALRKVINGVIYCLVLMKIMFSVFIHKVTAGCNHDVRYVLELPLNLEHWN